MPSTSPGQRCAMRARPLFQSLSRDVLALLQQGGRSLAGEGAGARQALPLEIALPCSSVTATLVTRTFLDLRAVDVGFNADRVLAFDVPQARSRYPDARASLEFADRLLPKISTLPGVQRAASVLLRPLWGVVGMDWPVTVEGQSPTDVAQNPLTNLEAVSPGYFDTMEIPLHRGTRHRRERPRGPCGCGGGQSEFREALLARRSGPRARAEVSVARLSVRSAVVHRRRDRR